MTQIYEQFVHPSSPGVDPETCRVCDIRSLVPLFVPKVAIVGRPLSLSLFPPAVVTRQRVAVPALSAVPVLSGATKH